MDWSGTGRRGAHGSMGFEPVGTDADGDLDGEAFEGERGLHLTGDDVANHLFLRTVEVEDEFVVDLEDHLRLQVLFGELAVDADHGQLDHVGGGALDGHVDGVALGEGASGGVARVDVGQVAAASEQRGGIATFAGPFDTLGDEGADVGILLKILADERRRFAARDGELRGQAEGRDAVENAEVDALGHAPLVGGDIGNVEVEDAGGGGGVDVEVGVEGLEHAMVAGQGGDDAELDLGIVGGEDQMLVVGGDDGGAYLASAGGADRYVLQVGVGRREAAGGGDGLMIDGVQAAGGGVDELGEGEQVGVEQFRHGAVFEDEGDDGMARRELDEDILGGGELARGGERRLVGDAELLVEHVGELLGRGDVEGGAGELVDLPGDVVALGGELAGELLQGGGVDADAGAFHVDEDIDQGQLDVGIEADKGSVAQGGGKEGIELPEGGGLVGGAGGLEAYARGGDGVEGVAHLGIDEVVGQLHVEDGAGEGKLTAVEKVDEGLEIEAELGGDRMEEQTRESVVVEGGEVGHPGGVGMGGEGHLGAVDDDGHVGTFERAEHLGGEGLHLDGRLGGGEGLVEKRRGLGRGARVQRGCRVGSGSRIGAGLRRGGGRGHGMVVVGGDASGKLAELELGGELLEQREIGRLEKQLVGIERDGSVEADGGELLGEEGLFGILLDECAGLVVGDLVGMGDDFLDGAELGDEFFGGLLPHSGHTGDVVGGVAPEAEEVDDLAAMVDAEELVHLERREYLVGLAGTAEAVHLDARGDELGEIFVGGDHNHLVETGILGGMRERADDIVGLEALAGEDGYAESLDHLSHPRERELDVLGHRVAVGLIFGIELMAEGGLLEVEGDADMRGLQMAEQVVEGGGKTQYGRRVEALGVDAGFAVEGVVGAIDDGHTVDEDQFLHTKGLAVSWSYSIRFLRMLQAR